MIATVKDQVFKRPVSLPAKGDGYVAQAWAMVPALLAEQEATEKRTHYSDATHAAFKDAGFYRLLIPRQFGGLEVEIESFFRVVVAIASGCPSTGWQFCFGALHAVTVGSLFGLKTQAELFGDGHFVCAATVKPQGNAKLEADGGCTLDGTFNYCSGIPYSTHFMSHAFIEPRSATEARLATFVAPRTAWTRLSDWGDSLGLKGSGSHSIQFVDGKIPARFLLPEVDILNHRPQGESPCPMHYGRTMALWFLEPASVAVGSIKGALVEYADMMRTKQTMRPPPVPRMKDPDFRRSYGMAMARVAYAESALYSLCREWWTLSLQSMQGEKEFSIEDELRLCLTASQIIDTCWHVMESIVFPTAGSSAARDGQRMQRYFRDMAMARSHAYNTQIDGMARHLSDELLGGSAASSSDVFNVKQ